jgi:hypothetical protein
VLAQHRGVQGGDGEPAVRAAVAVVDHGERRRGPGVGLLGLEASGFLAVGGGGVDDLEHPAAQDPQRLGVVLARLGEQEGLGRRGHPGRDIRRQVVDRVDDDPRLVGAQLARRQGSADRLVAFERRRQSGEAVRLGAGRTRGVRPPVRRARGPGVQARLHALGVAQDPHQQLVELTAGLGQQHQRVARIGCGHRPQRCLRDRGQLLTHPPRQGGDPVRFGVLEG